MLAVSELGGWHGDLSRVLAKLESDHFWTTECVF